MSADPVAMAKRLQEKALKAAAERRDEKSNARLMQWQRVKNESPEIALLLSNLNNEFGKPKAVVVSCGDEVILRSGEFERPRDFSVQKPVSPFWRKK